MLLKGLYNCVGLFSDTWLPEILINLEFVWNYVGTLTLYIYIRQKILIWFAFPSIEAKYICGGNEKKVVIQATDKK